MNANGIVWDVNADVAGTFLRQHVEGVKLDTLAKAAGYSPTGDHAYLDREAGYDGWELYGYFDGQPFNLYTRFGSLRIGGREGLNVPALLAALWALEGGK